MPNGGNSPRLSRGLHPLARGPALERTWPDEVSSLGPGNMGMPQLQHHQTLGAGAWSLPARQPQPQHQQQTHLRGPYSGLRDYSALQGAALLSDGITILGPLRSVAVTSGRIFLRQGGIIGVRVQVHLRVPHEIMLLRDQESELRTAC